jgi:hypothetical protein
LEITKPPTHLTPIIWCSGFKRLNFVMIVQIIWLEQFMSVWTVYLFFPFRIHKYNKGLMEREKSRYQGYQSFFLKKKYNHFRMKWFIAKLSLSQNLTKLNWELHYFQFLHRPPGLVTNSAGTYGGSRSRVCTRLTLRLALEKIHDFKSKFKSKDLESGKKQ